MEASQQYADQHGLTLDDTLQLRDLGVSALKGKNAKSGALAGFLEAIEGGRVVKGSTLIVESLDRLSRAELMKSLYLFNGILEKGVNIATLTPEREYTRKV